MDFLMMRMRYFLYVLFILTVNAQAQLSPGKLHKAHSGLEGIENCSKCHSGKQKIVPSRCLSCHKALNARIAAGKGLHAQEGYGDCETCHVEHHGRDYELIWWPDGKDQFDHSLTGYALEGKHKDVPCEKCHQAQNIRNKQELIDQGKDLNHTYLGLDRSCLSCHVDEHRGQMQADQCLTCHNVNGWKPASGFDHSKTKFPLIGKHKKVKCRKCHPLITDEKYPQNRDYVKFKGLRFASCVDCHKDVHANKFGSRCVQCHSTQGWRIVNEKQFDHNKTAFPLQGKHVQVPCNKCHKPGQPIHIEKFSRCTDCHADYHVGQFAHRRQKGACEECHSVSGFTPAKFTIEQHNRSNYPLKGSHLAVPCIACHKKERINSQETIRFRFASTRCADCHQNPHQQEVNGYLQKGGCEYCHTVESWRAVTFDHNQTKFPLQIKHSKIACGACHKPIEQADGSTVVRLTNLPLLCNSCHKDVHYGQFRDAEARKRGQKTTHCDRCHTPVDWLAEKFDHNRDSDFKLEGAHKSVRCEQCHVEITLKGKTFRLYKPLRKKCSDCHGSKPVQLGGKR